MEVHINFTIPIVYIQCWLAFASGCLITSAFIKADNVIGHSNPVADVLFVVGILAGFVASLIGRL